MLDGFLFPFFIKLLKIVLYVIIIFKSEAFLFVAVVLLCRYTN